MCREKVYKTGGEKRSEKDGIGTWEKNGRGGIAEIKGVHENKRQKESEWVRVEVRGMREWRWND